MPMFIFSQSICDSNIYLRLIEPFKLNKSKIEQAFGKWDNRLIKIMDSSFSNRVTNPLWSIHPVVRLRPNRIDTNKIIFSFDTTSEVVLFYNANKTTYTYNLSNTNQVGFNVEDSFIKKNADSLYRKKSFFIYFLDEEKFGRDLIAYCDGSNTQILDKNITSFSTIEDVINYRYGSIEKYLELCVNEEEVKKIRTRLQVTNVQDASILISKSWQLRTQYLPTDTAQNLQLLINDIDSACNINQNQRRLIANKIQSFVNMFKGLKMPSYNCNYDFNFMGWLDIKVLVTDILTTDQMVKCERYFKEMHQMVTNAQNLIYTSFNTTSKQGGITVGAMTKDGEKKYKDYIKSIFIPSKN